MVPLLHKYEVICDLSWTWRFVAFQSSIISHHHQSTAVTMIVSFEVFRGSHDGVIMSSEISCGLERNQVYIETTHSGVCATDEIFLYSGQALGHEGIGIVKKVGPGVASVQVGDRVGFAYVRRVCGSCNSCITGGFLMLFMALVLSLLCWEFLTERTQDTISIAARFAYTGNATLTLAHLDPAWSGMQIASFTSPKDTHPSMRLP